MIEHLVTRFEVVRLDRHRRDLLRQEEAAIARLGEKTLADSSSRSGRLVSLVAEATAARNQLQAVRSAQGASPSAASRERIEVLGRKLYQIHLTAGRLALALPPTGAEAEVLAIRAEMAAAAGERDRLRGEGNRLADETWTQVRQWTTPRAPALTAMVVAWLVAHGYAVTHTAAILGALGLSSKRRGPHWVSLATDTFIVRYVMPLAIAAVCAYLAHRLAGRVRATVEDVRERSRQASRSAAEARVTAAAEVRETRDARTRRAVEKSR
ncbi:MAG TPA: hypothetical protein VH763_20165 [Gemmatimonadales bacterium]|jgi:hypothetical protein